jgi:SET domain-containing protein
VEIKKSNIPNAGQGVFATKNIHADQFIVPYDGEIVDNYELNLRYGKKARKIYAIEIQHGLYEDGLFYRGVGTMVNHSEHPNAVLTLDSSDNRVVVVALKFIPAGHEILVNYGPRYWM